MSHDICCLASLQLVMAVNRHVDIVRGDSDIVKVVMGSEKNVRTYSCGINLRRTELLCRDIYNMPRFSQSNSVGIFL